MDGNHMPQDKTEGLRLLRLAAGKNESSAMHDLGLRYLEGRGIPKDYQESCTGFNPLLMQATHPRKLIWATCTNRPSAFPPTTSRP